jgi:hypothetical protein
VAETPFDVRFDRSSRASDFDISRASTKHRLQRFSHREDGARCRFGGDIFSASIGRDYTIAETDY